MSVTWIFVALAAVAVFVVAAVTVGRETFRLGHQIPATIFDLDEAVAYVSEGVPIEAQGRLSYDDVQAVIEAHIDYLRDRGVVGVGSQDPAVVRVNGSDSDVVVVDEEALAFTLGQVDRAGMDVRDDDAYAVILALHRYLADIGAIGPSAAT